VASDGTSGSPIVSPSGAALDGGLSGRYATALYELADDRRALDEVVEQAEALGRLIDESAPLRALLGDRAVDIVQARSAVLAVLESQGFGEIIRNFVGVVTNNRRLSSLRDILSAFAALVARRRGVVVAEVSSAHPLTDLQRTQLRARLLEAGYSKVNIQERVDGTLLGGLVVRVGARLYDASVRSRLARLHHAMKGAA
jgi:F-type H+-transporting ATPase subunit delta